jgi:hypothetical protein
MVASERPMLFQLAFVVTRLSVRQRRREHDQTVHRAFVRILTAQRIALLSH